MSAGPVADATVLISLAKIGHLELLDQLFPTVRVPEAVYEECVDRGRAEGYRDAIAIDAAFERGLMRHRLDEKSSTSARQFKESADLGAGEAAAIAASVELGVRCLTDDHAARQTAQAMGVDVGGNIYVLLSGLDEGILTPDSYLDAIDALTDEGFRMNASLYRQAIEAGRTLEE